MVKLVDGVDGKEGNNRIDLTNVTLSNDQCTTAPHLILIPMPHPFPPHQQE